MWGRTALHYAYVHKNKEAIACLLAAIAIAFTVLNTVSFGGLSAGMALVGVAATLVGIGLFAKSYSQNNLETSKEIKYEVN